MNFLNGAIAAAVLSTFAVSAQAQDSNTYINAGVQTFEGDTWNIVGRVGYNFSENFGVEGEASVGVIGTDEDGFDVSTPYSFGGFLIGRYPVSDKFEFFGRVGYSATNFDVDGAGDITLDGIAVGGGIQYNLDDVSGIRLGYTAADVDVGTADVIDLVYVRKF